MDRSGNVFVAGPGNNRVQKFDGNSAFLAKWGSSGSGDGQFQQPIVLAVDRSGSVFVTDSVNARVQKFTNEGAFLGTVGCPGVVDGGFGFAYGIALDSASGRLVVSDITLNRIQTFACL